MIYGDWLEALQEFNELAGDNWKIVLNRMLRGKADISELDRNIQAAFRVFVCSVKKMILEDRKKDLVGTLPGSVVPLLFYLEGNGPQHLPL